MNEKTYIIQDLKSNKGEVQDARQVGPSGSGSVTPAAIVTATEQMTEEQAADTLTNIGGVTSDDVDAKLTPYTITMTHTSAIPGNGTWTSSKTWAQLVTAYSAGKPIHAIIGGLSLVGGRVVVTHMIGNQMVIYLTGDDDSQNHYDGFYMILSDGSFTYTDMTPAQDCLQLTATPTAGPSGHTLMSGTWSGATWAEVTAAIQASRLIQINVAGMGPVTLLFNVTGTTNVDSVCFTFVSVDTVVIARVALFSNSNFTTYLVARADPNVITVGASVATIIPEPNTIYQCGELTSLTITDPPATGAYSIVFTSGSTATTTTIPATILGLESFAPEANTLYEINVLDNRAVVGSWAVSA